jgi:hypothetical protein
LLTSFLIVRGAELLESREQGDGRGSILFVFPKTECLLAMVADFTAGGMVSLISFWKICSRLRRKCQEAKRRAVKVGDEIAWQPAIK